MIYRKLGPTGIQVSVISYGNWVNSNSKEAQQLTNDCVKAAWDLGINFFDTAEFYGKEFFTQDTVKPKDKSVLPSKLLKFLAISLCSRPKFSGEVPTRSPL